MSVTVATVPTAHASRYLQQLCKHWGHKFPVDFTPEHGRIELPGTVCSLDAGPDDLLVRIETAPENLERMQGVVAEHVQRFAFKETLSFAWTAP